MVTLVSGMSPIPARQRTTRSSPSGWLAATCLGIALVEGILVLLALVGGVIAAVKLIQLQSKVKYMGHGHNFQHFHPQGPQCS